MFKSNVRTNYKPNQNLVNRKKQKRAGDEVYSHRPRIFIPSPRSIGARELSSTVVRGLRCASSPALYYALRFILGSLF